MIPLFFALGMAVLVGLLACQLVKAWDVADQCGCSFSDAIWLLDR